MSGKLFPCRQSFFCHLFWFPLFTVTFTDVDANEQNKGCSYFAQLCHVGLLHCNLVFLGADRKLSWHLDRVGFLQVLWFPPPSKNIFIRSILKTSMSCLAVMECVKMFWLNWSSVNNCSLSSTSPGDTWSKGEGSDLLAGSGVRRAAGGMGLHGGRELLREISCA